MKIEKWVRWNLLGDSCGQALHGYLSGLHGITIHVPRHVDDRHSLVAEDVHHVGDLPIEIHQVLDVNGLLALAAVTLLHAAGDAPVGDFRRDQQAHANIGE